MKERFSLDVNLKELLEYCPGVKEILMKYNYSRLEEEDIEDVVIDKLTLKGFCRLMDLDDEAQGNLWQEIQNLVRQMEE
ncbi:MAG: DUF1858 domain-containing protein [Acidobacteria bacterium]|jgi:hypothetical protein|nr:MAG: DUF1858 domain-containing protein [Acidobacteriota bacterium]